jgi:hypothetical protein
VPGRATEDAVCCWFAGDDEEEQVTKDFKFYNSGKLLDKSELKYDDTMRLHKQKSPKQTEYYRKTFEEHFDQINKASYDHLIISQTKNLADA